MSFYDDMALVTKELLSSAVFGQGVVILSRKTTGVVNPAQPWLPVVPVVQTETLGAAVSGAGKYADGVTILATDFRVVAAVPVIDWRMNSDVTMTISVDGKTLQVLQTKGLPAAGTPAAIEIMARA